MLILCKIKLYSGIKLLKMWLMITFGLTFYRGDERKSMSTERTFRDKSKPEDLFRICQDLCDSLAKQVEKKGLKVWTSRYSY